MAVLLRASVSALACLSIAIPAFAQEQTRRIEEVIVTAEKRQSTVSDTSISITAIGEQMIEDLGIQSANEFVNFIPATTRDDFDIRIRGVGRNFRSLGGDPGVATYYNGVYSEDALIALTENALWDLERIEVLRGPQGTLYGRNSIGGAINYISKGPTDEWGGSFRTQIGQYNNLEVYGAVGGPIIEDVLNFRVTAAKQARDGVQDGQFGTQDADDVNDQNTSFSLEWTPSDTITVETRYNDRRSLRRIGASTLIDQGWGNNRGTRGTDLYAFGVRAVDATTPGASMFTHPITGAIGYGAPIRPGVDIASSSFPNEAFMGIDYLNGRAGDPDKADPEIFSNGENDEEFDQQAVAMTVTWDLSEETTLKYVFGYNDFLYTFDIDGDHSNGLISDPNARTHEEVHNFSHELQLLWSIGDNLEMTSGLYYFDSNRLQDFGFNSRRTQGRVQGPADYGLLDAPNIFLGGANFFQAFGAATALWTQPHLRLSTAPVGTGGAGVGKVILSIRTIT
ncbi:MAG: TonB-dependent receptor plug domain-containing protein [Pseudomonadales bacterium]|nr:TonB-dependent receptor plug domain-containing protein [Pseudomonadales bacterium]